MPTAATLLINALSPAQRALLFTALNAFEVLHDECLEEVETTALNPLLTAHLAAAHRYSIAGTQLLKKQLFAECFTEDLRIEKYIHQKIKLDNERAISHHNAYGKMA